MTTPIRFNLVIALVLACAGVVCAQENPKSKGGSISGRVTVANKGVAGVAVTITMSGDALSGLGLQYKAVTDDEGRFRISNLPPRKYFVWPFVPAFVIAESMGLYPQGKTITVLEGEAVDDINFTLTRGGVITGKITDSTGRPVVNQQVRILPIRDEMRRLVGSVYPSIHDIQTDDRGIYRVYGLPAGAYKVAVGDPEFAAATSIGGSRFYTQTFHPDVTDEAKAKVIEVTEGSEASGIDITVARGMTGFSANGRFVDAKSGQGVPNVNFGLTVLSDKNQTRGYISVRGVSANSGSFHVDNLPPGTYAVSILGTTSNNHYGASESFSIRDADVSDIEVKVHRASTISGKVIVEGIDDRSILAKLSRARLQTVSFSDDENAVGTMNYSEINADGSFQVGPLRPGTAIIEIGSADRNVTPEFALLAIDHNGVDKSHGFQISEGENITGVRLVAGYGTGIIRGTVRIEGTLPPGTHMDAAFSRAGSSLTVGHTRMDARGQFVFDHVPPGNYNVGVNAYLPSGPVSARQTVVTTNGSTTEVTITLKVNASPNPEP